MREEDGDLLLNGDKVSSEYDDSTSDMLSLDSLKVRFLYTTTRTLTITLTVYYNTSRYTLSIL